MPRVGSTSTLATNRKRGGLFVSRLRKFAAGAAAVASATTVSLPLLAKPAAAAALTTTPIQHLVVIYQENVSFDHYFGTYPKATNASGNPFAAAPGTPAVNGLNTAAPGGGTLLTNNPNKDASNNQANPRRLDPANVSDVLTCDQGHNYSDEQKAFNGGAMDKFVTTVGTGPPRKDPEGNLCNPSQVMNYYDGNAVTGLWNYAQHYAMSDNSYSSTFGPSSPGALNLASGNTGGVDTAHAIPTSGSNNPLTNGDTVPDGKGGYSLIADPQPYYDDCSTRNAVAMTGQNVGDLLNTRGVSWGWFQGGNRPSTPFATANSTNGGTNHPTPSPQTSSAASSRSRMPRTRASATRCTRSGPLSAAPGSTATRTITSPTTSLSTTTPRRPTRIT
ncbi:MAG: hypothetical protein JF887_05760 [Candidatus Dormibacteraeota bacterium]|uniref:Phospholipase C n=1 Tax=Candidatus Amunia macphersoniae TaxID=3127014 RepID=A0A934KG82_9BACT|nr:hypothetical protein [Candidatus Dormibacteraeota bacterium]